MNRVTPVAVTRLVRVARFDHPPDLPHQDPVEEAAAGFSVAFVERGSYEITLRDTPHHFRAGMVFVTHKDQEYRCRHDGPAPEDACLIVDFEDGAVDDLLRAAGDRAAFPPSNRLAYCRLRLLDALEGRDPLTIETRIGEVLETLGTAGATAARLCRATQVAWYARRIDAARQILETRHAEPWSLAMLGREVGMSPFQFSRVFRELAGLPPHRYLIAVRLEQAARRLEEGRSVTDACFDVGFSSLSHFTRSFRRAYGVPPSASMRKKVQATGPPGDVSFRTRHRDAGRRT